MATVLGFAFLFQIVLLFRGSVAIYECTYEDVYAGSEVKFCSTGCCATDCCDDIAWSGTGAIVGGVMVSVFVTLFIITMVICHLVPSCPLARRRRAIIVRRTIVTNSVVPPENHFQNPLSHPPSAGSHYPNTVPPSYDQAVPSAFTPLPAVHPPQTVGNRAN